MRRACPPCRRAGPRKEKGRSGRLCLRMRKRACRKLRRRTLLPPGRRAPRLSEICGAAQAFYARRRNIRRPHRRAGPCARGQRAPTASGASFLLWNFSALSGTATTAARAEKRFQRSTAYPSAEAPFPPARRKICRASRRPPRSRVFPASAGRAQRVAHVPAKAFRFPPRGKHESGALDGGPVSARSRKDARRACFSVLRACVPA